MGTPQLLLVVCSAHERQASTARTSAAQPSCLIAFISSRTVDLHARIVLRQWTLQLQGMVSVCAAACRLPPAACRRWDAGAADSGPFAHIVACQNCLGASEPLRDRVASPLPPGLVNVTCRGCTRTENDANALKRLL